MRYQGLWAWIDLEDWCAEGFWLVPEESKLPVSEVLIDMINGVGVRFRCCIVATIHLVRPNIDRNPWIIRVQTVQIEAMLSTRCLEEDHSLMRVPHPAK